MPRMQYKQIAKIAAKHEVGFARCRVSVDAGTTSMNVPAVRLTGMLSDIQAAVRALDLRYYTLQTEEGFYIYV